MITTKEILLEQDKRLKRNFIKKVKSYSLRGLYKEKEEYNAFYFQALPNKVKVKVGKNDNFYYEGYSGTYAWEMYERVYNDKEAALKHGAEYPSPIRSLLDCTKLGHKVEFQKKIRLEDEELFELKITLKDGFKRLYYINTETYVIERAIDYRKYHPQPNEKIEIVESLFKDYKEKDGALFPIRSIDRNFETQEILSEIVWTEITINPDFPPSFFEKLENIQKTY